MTYEELQKANATIRTMDVRGKDYAEVNQRVKAFRMLFPQGYIKTDLISNDGEVGKRTCVIRAEVGIGDMVLATGTAYENEGTGNINRTSYVENCETSAVGRALGFLGLGIDVAIASAEEVKNAIAQQTPAQSAQNAPRRKEDTQSSKISGVQVKTLLSLLEMNGLTLDSMLHTYGLTSEHDMTQAQYDDAIGRISAWAQRAKAKREGKA